MFMTTDVCVSSELGQQSLLAGPQVVMCHAEVLRYHSSVSEQPMQISSDEVIMTGILKHRKAEGP